MYVGKAAAKALYQALYEALYKALYKACISLARWTCLCALMVSFGLRVHLVCLRVHLVWCSIMYTSFCCCCRQISLCTAHTKIENKDVREGEQDVLYCTHSVTLHVDSQADIYTTFVGEKGALQHTPTHESMPNIHSYPTA